MGNTHGGKSSLKDLIEILNARSRRGDSRSPDTVTFGGMTMYLNEQEERYTDWRPSHPVDRVNRYRDVVALAGRIGMSEQATYQLLTEAYRSLNGRENALGKVGILAPARPQPPTPSVTPPSRNDNRPQHPEPLQREAIEIAINPHSYCSLMGITTEHLLALDSRTLSEIVHADRNFIASTTNFWNLPQRERDAVATDVRRDYNASLCYGLGLTGPTNATPTEAFVNGRRGLLRAVELGYDAFGSHTGQLHDRRALTAYGEVAIVINLALNVTGTLTGRGTDSISERTMAFSPDGHKN